MSRDFQVTISATVTVPLVVHVSVADDAPVPDEAFGVTDNAALTMSVVVADFASVSLRDIGEQCPDALDELDDAIFCAWTEGGA